MSDNPSGMPAAADNPMAAQQPPAPVASTEGVDVAAVEHLRHEALTGRVTLLFAGHDHVHCHARVLREAVLGVEEDLT